MEQHVGEPASPSGDRVALVTGAVRGLGRETARQLAQAGIHVIVGARDADAANRAAAELREQRLPISAIKLDVTSGSDRQDAFSHIERAHGRLDILVNNAGVLLDSTDAGLPPIHEPSETPPSVVRDSFEVNFFAHVFMTQAMLPLLKRSAAPRVVNVSSIRGSLTLLSDPSSPVHTTRLLGYDASKAALNAFTILIAEELRATTVKVNAIHPGWVRTDMGGGQAQLGVEGGARTAVRYATLPDDGPTGGFFHLDERLPW